MRANVNKLRRIKSNNCVRLGSYSVKRVLCFDCRPGCETKDDNKKTMNPKIIEARKAAKEAKLHASILVNLLGPRVIGGKYFCGYWRVAYELVAINEENPMHPSITVSWDATTNRPAHETTHSTCWDAKCDRIFSPMVLEIAS